ncbi:NAD(P)-dependent oxidoreductase [Halomonas denitrificans]|uniref:NAD(P)-dependent oxidoreductase n=1 Tax=Halomonas TaxID=2745 RepID=UPI001C976883|nr:MULTISPECIES: NAD(P)-dependent oxidoreductase [Halomonas]MBY5930480.1 NAD(P)-dependent oxidoreductase [Halomonas sp. DP8Y7-3]MCA0976366.1 NAD(P)-dependent oxidoreductase [Halomonas denitrificans]
MSALLPRLGFIGIGLMGDPLSRRLAKAGHPLVLYNRTRAKADAVAAETGARVADSVAQLAAQVDVVITCVANTEVLRELMLGAEGVIANARPGGAIIDLTSADPATTRELAQLADESGLSWVDAPVSGGVAGAEAGSLAIMCGGDRAHVDTARTILQPLASRITHMGPVGAGQVTKLCNQLLVACNTAAIAEMVALAESSGVDAGLLPEALAGGFADSTPFRMLVPRMAERDFKAPSWHLRTLLKDVDMATAQGYRQASATPMAALAAQLMRSRLARGEGESDPATLIRLYRDDAQRS